MTKEKCKNPDLFQSEIILIIKDINTYYINSIIFINPIKFKADA
jgi:hypothetical protein